jgi:hypothetical protein
VERSVHYDSHLSLLLAGLDLKLVDRVEPVW